MRFLTISLLAVVALVAACETTPEEGASASTSGAGSADVGAVAMESRVDIEKAALPPAEALVEVGDRVFFDYDRYDLSSEARATLEKQAALLRKYPAQDVVIQGHCDERGTREYNLALGERRANSVKDYLVALGISPSRLRTVSYGEERPAAVGSSEAALSQNRRAVSVIAGGAAGV